MKMTIKQMIKPLIIGFVFILILANSCSTVDSGHKGVKVNWGGKTDLSQVYDEGVQIGICWLWNRMIEYDVRETTIVKSFEFNDKNNMVTKVEMSLDFNLNPEKVNLLHTQITDVETKILKTLKSAGKEVVPQYSAVELNITKRTEAEQKLSQIISAELPEFYVEFARIQMTDVDIPANVAKLAEETAVQLGRNELAKKKEAEQIALAKARVAKATGDADAEIARARGEYEAAKFDAKTKDILSRPQMLRLKQLEVLQTYADKRVSPYGTNNVFDKESVTLFLNKS